MPLRGASFRDWARVLVTSSLLFLTGCGTVRVAGVLNASNVSVVSGTVSFVQVTVLIDGKGTSTDVTVVTLLMPLARNTFTFCGNQASQFAMNTSVQISFTSAGESCADLVAVLQQ